MNMNRTYLHVPPEEYAEVEALRAVWDDESKRWYIGIESNLKEFVRWRPPREDAGAFEFTIVSDEAYVASARAPCVSCGTPIELVCIYCETGSDSGSSLEQFTISSIVDVDPALARQLENWPGFRCGSNAPSSEEACFANRCLHCGAVQDVDRLHSEPDAVFFSVLDSSPETLGFTALLGRIGLNGDYHFEV